MVGATILGSGETALIIDIPRLVGAARPSVDADAAFVAPEQAGTDELAPVSSRGRIALVVDDSLSVRRVLSKTLERHGWTTVQARDGVEALESLEATAVDVIVTDIEMPRMDGFELVGAVRRRPGIDQTPIVVLTSRAGMKHREKAFELGANAYLVKPFQEQELVDTLENNSRLQVRQAS
jgi:chemosensory pili system protein ChpA (sensor histidine kinase/response regulator)